MTIVYHTSMKLVKCIVFLLIIFYSSFAHAQISIQFYFIQPGGEGNTDEAAPYLASLFDYLTEKTGKTFEGLYLNDSDEALEALKSKKIDLAIMSPEFISKNRNKYNFTVLLRTIPTYSSGPFEKYFIMAHQKAEILELAAKNKTIALYSSQSYDEAFLKDVVFSGNDQIKEIPWALTLTENLSQTIKDIATGKDNIFVLLTGHEFSVVNKLRKKNKDFETLKLVFSSKELPSSQVISVGNINKEQLNSIKQALITMPNTLQGNLILKKLRLKGFAE